MAAQSINIAHVFLLMNVLILYCMCTIGQVTDAPNFSAPAGNETSQFLEVFPDNSFHEREQGESQRHLLNVLSSTANIGQRILQFAPQMLDNFDQEFFSASRRIKTHNAERNTQTKYLESGVFSANSESDFMTQCENDTRLFIQSVAANKSWALQMVDAFGKPGPAILDFNTLWPGAYDECLGVTVEQNETLGVQGFAGQYCQAELTVEDSADAILVIREGLCVPDTCSENEILDVFNSFLLENSRGLNLSSVACSAQQSSMDAKAFAALGVGGCFLLLVVVGTLLDITLTQLSKQQFEETLDFTLASRTSSYEREPLVARQLYKEKLGSWSGLLTAFSAYTNGRQLLSTDHQFGSLPCLHAIRVLSMIWVILGHTIWVALMSGSWNILPWLQASRQRILFQVISNATLAGDSFFVLSGVLVSYLTLREMRHQEGHLKWFRFYLHRIWRLTPTYMFVLFIYLALMPYWGSGPLWPNFWPDRENCARHWWLNLLYVNNLVNTDKMCFAHSWYLANDVQFYILSPFIIVPFYFSALLGTLCAILFFFASAITAAILTLADNFPPALLASVHTSSDSSENWFTDFYIKPYVRMSPYVVGLVTGYILYRINGRLRLRKVTALIGWLIAAALGLFSLFGLYDATANDDMPLWVAAVYNATGRAGWALGLAWVIVACASNNGGFVNTILSWGVFLPLSRLTYCAYLIHMPVIYTIFLLRQTAFYITDIEVVIYFMGLLLLTYLLALAVVLILEAPLKSLETVLIIGPNSRFPRYLSNRMR